MEKTFEGPPAAGGIRGEVDFQRDHTPIPFTDFSLQKLWATRCTTGSRRWVSI